MIFQNSRKYKPKTDLKDDRHNRISQIVSQRGDDNIIFQMMYIILKADKNLAGRESRKSEKTVDKVLNERIVHENAKQHHARQHE
jgi:hypothetical protein